MKSSRSINITRDSTLIYSKEAFLKLYSPDLELPNGADLSLGAITETVREPLAHTPLLELEIQLLGSASINSDSNRRNYNGNKKPRTPQQHTGMNYRQTSS